MPSDRRLEEITKNLAEPKRRASDFGTVYAIYNNYADIRMGGSPTLLKNVPIQGDSDTLYVGKKVRVEWAQREGTVGKAPFIAGGSGDFISGQGGSSTVTVDNVTIEKGYVGLSVKKGGIGTQHLNFNPSMDGHTHKTPLELGGWKFTPDGIMYTDLMYIHPHGLMKLGGGYPNEDDVIVIDSSHATYRLWAGDQNPASAPFSVTKAGAISATSGTIAGWTIDSSKIAGGGIEMYSAGYIQSNPFSSGSVGFRIDDDVAEFNNVRVRGELHSAVFVYNEIHATSGTLGVFESAGILLQDTNLTDNPLYLHIKDPDTGAAELFTSGDKLRIKDGSGKDTWFNCTGTSYQTDHWRYTVTIASGTSSGTYTKGATVVNYGASGGGFITMSADETIGKSPNINLAVHGGAPWSTTTVLGRIGNLNGVYGQSTDVYGFAFGDYDAERYIRWVNSTGVLQIAGTVSIGSGHGFTISAAAHFPFDGPSPIKANFDLNTMSHLGAVNVGTGLLSSYFGKWHKSARFGWATDNLLTNPCFENNTTGWTLNQGGTGGTMTRVTNGKFVYIRSASVEVKAGTSWVQALSGTISVPNGSTVTLTAMTFVDSFSGGDVGDAYVYIWDTSTPTTRAVKASTKVNQWEEVLLRWKNDTGVAKNVVVLLRNNANDSATKCYFDACKLSLETLNTPYFDGGFPGASWAGTAHASTSSISTTPYLQYNDVDFPFKQGSITMWVKPTAYIDDVTSEYQYMTDFGYTGGLIFYIRGTKYLALYLAGTLKEFLLLNGTNFSVGNWHHLAVTWDMFANETLCYLDGVQVGTAGTYTGNWNPNAETLYVGSRGTGSPFLGHIDDYALIPRVLTPPEVEQIYYADAPLNVSGRQFGIFMAEEGVGKIEGDLSGIRAYDADYNKKVTLSSYGLKIKTRASGYNYDTGIDFINPSENDTLLQIYTNWYTAMASGTTLSAQNTDSKDNNLFIRSEAGLELSTTKTSQQIRLQTNAGYIDIGPINGSWCHINTDRGYFYFYKGANMVGSGLTLSSATETPTSAGYLAITGGMRVGGSTTSISDRALTFYERSSAPGAVAGYGQIWSHDTPNLMFGINDDGDVYQLGPDIQLWVYLGTPVGGATQGLNGTYIAYVNLPPSGTTDYPGIQIGGVPLPKGWAGQTIYAELYYSGTSTNTGTVNFAVEMEEMWNGSTISTAYPATVLSSSAAFGGSTTVYYRRVFSGSLSAFTTNESAANIRVMRYSAQDSYTGTIRLYAARLFIHPV